MSTLTINGNIIKKLEFLEHKILAEPTSSKLYKENVERWTLKQMEEQREKLKEARINLVDCVESGNLQKVQSYKRDIVGCIHWLDNMQYEYKINRSLKGAPPED